jgi:hypothetical protein
MLIIMIVIITSMSIDNYTPDDAHAEVHGLGARDGGVVPGGRQCGAVEEVHLEVAEAPLVHGHVHRVAHVLLHPGVRDVQTKEPLARVRVPANRRTVNNVTTTTRILSATMKSLARVCVPAKSQIADHERNMNNDKNHNNNDNNNSNNDNNNDNNNNDKNASLGGH